jgi:hypothetical protein
LKAAIRLATSTRNGDRLHGPTCAAGLIRLPAQQNI